MNTVTTLQIGPTTGGSYEKAAGRFIAWTSDPSLFNAAGNVVASKDAVGILTQAFSAPDNPHGSISALNSVAFFQAGGDGGGSSIEADTQNNATPQPLISQPNSKIGVLAVAFGTAQSTAAFLVSNNGQTWFDGLIVSQAAVSNSAIRLIASGTLTTDLFRVDAAGNTLAASLTITNGQILTPGGGTYVTLGASGAGAGVSAVFGVTPASTDHLFAYSAAAGGYVVLTTAGTGAAAGMSITAGPGQLALGGSSVAINAILYTGNTVFVPGLPTADPHQANRIWRSGTTLMISGG